MSCNDEWDQRAKRLEQLTYVARQGVNAAAICSYPGCDRPLIPKTMRCILNHPQEPGGPVQAYPREVEGLLSFFDALEALEQEPSPKVQAMHLFLKVGEPSYELGVLAVEMGVSVLDELKDQGDSWEHDHRVQSARSFLVALGSVIHSDQVKLQVDADGMYPQHPCRRCDQPLNEDGGHPAELYAGTYTGVCYQCMGGSKYVTAQHFDGAQTISYPPMYAAYDRGRADYIAYPDCPECNGEGFRRISRSLVLGGSYRRYCQRCFDRFYDEPHRHAQSEQYQDLYDRAMTYFGELGVEAGLAQKRGRKHIEYTWLIDDPRNDPRAVMLSKKARKWLSDQRERVSALVPTDLLAACESIVATARTWADNADGTTAREVWQEQVEKYAWVVSRYEQLLDGSFDVPEDVQHVLVACQTFVASGKGWDDDFGDDARNVWMETANVCEQAFEAYRRGP